MASVDRAQLLQTVDQVSTVLERVRALKQQKDLVAAGRELTGGYDLLGVERRKLQLTEAAQVAGDLRNIEYIRLLAELLANEADVLRLEGDHDSSVATARWTISMLLRGAPPGDYSTLTRGLLALAEGQEPPEPV